MLLGGLASNPTQGRSFEAETQAFLNATGITDATISSAINDLVLALKNNGLWNKCTAIYPFVGGSAATHKYNLKDPRDLDAAYRLTFSGSWTHNATGSVPTAAGTYADTHLKPSDIGQDSIHLSYYTPNNQELSSSVAIMGGTYTSGSNVFYLSDMNSNFMYSGANGAETQLGGTTGQSGLYILNRTASNAWGVTLPDGTARTSTSASTTPSSSLNIYIASLNFGPNPASTYPAIGVPCALATLGTGLTSPDIAALRTTAQNFETTLSRNA